MRDPLPVPTELELLANLLLGDDEEGRQLPPATGVGARAAIELVVAESLARPPCVVSFSGGRDSSAVLALAAHVARREGLDLPVPVSMRFPGVSASDETEWQTLVLDHLALDERVVVTLDDELDVLGPTATDQLRRHGVRWPANAYMHEPVLAHAPGGSALTGVGGDELFGTRGALHVLVARRAARPRAGDLPSIAFTLSPGPVRAAVWRRRRAPHFPWLTAAGRDLVDAALARDFVSWPHRWDRAVVHWHRSRAFRAVRDTLPVFAADAGVRLVNPFLASTVLAELAAEGGPTGFPSRTAAMVHLVGDLLPAPVLDRSTKAAFTNAIRGPRTRAFALAWDGTGVDPGLVDVGALRATWLSDDPNANSLLLLQAAWLAQAGRDEPPR